MPYSVVFKVTFYNEKFDRKSESLPFLKKLPFSMEILTEFLANKTNIDKK